MHEASEEQLNVVKYIDDYNVIVDSVAGSGKTTTVLHIAKQFDYRILLLTYNKKLRMETNHKKNKFKLDNLEVHTYHSFCFKYYDNKCSTDYEIINILKSNKSINRIIDYQLIIIDESQDMTPLYYELVLKIISDIKSDPKICVLGDVNQSIYQYNNADERFITYANKLFNLNVIEWKETKLSTSFRLTKQMADFLNNCVLKSNKLNAIKNGDKPRYIICDCFGDKNDRVLNEVKNYLKDYTPDDIFILAPSVRNKNTPVQKLANKLSNNNINIYVPNSDEEKLDDDVVKNKIVFSTFHQAKGLERRVVIVFGIDDSYFKYYKKNNNNVNVCPNEIYVALTRASEKMTILHHEQRGYIPFLDKEKLKEYCYCELSKFKIQKDKNKNKEKQISVIGLVRHLPSEIINKSLEFIKYKKINDREEMINIPIKTKQKNLYENVSDITGIAIPSYFELLHKNTMTIYDTVINKIDFEYLQNMNNIEYIYDINKINLKNITINQLLYISNIYCSYINGFNYKMKQIKEYNWLEEKKLKKAIERLDKLISKNSIFEKKVVIKGKKELREKIFCGYIDCIDNNNVYELKCTKELEKEHILQLSLYCYLYETYILEKQQENIQKYIISTGRKKDNKYIIKGDKVTVQINNNNIQGVVTYIYKNNDIKMKSNEGITRCKINNVIKNDSFDDKISELGKHNNKYYLLNILNNEMYEIEGTLENLQKMVEFIICNKYYNNPILNDEDFIKKMDQIASKYNNNNNNNNKQNKIDIKIRSNNNPTNYLCFDTETATFNRDFIQLAYIIYNNKMEEIKTVNRYVKDYRYITKGSFNVHGITNDKLKKEGINFNEIIVEFLNDINDAKYIIGHNINFDINVIKNDIAKYNVIVNEKNNYNPFENKIIYCTQNGSRSICNLKGKSNRKKNPKLQELYEFLFEKEMKNAHNALDDVKNTMKCFLALREKYNMFTNSN